MSVKRSRTKYKGKDKVGYYFIYGLDSIELGIDYTCSIFIKYADSDLKGLELSTKVLKLFYKLLDSDIATIEKLLKINMSSNGITDKEGNKIHQVMI